MARKQKAPESANDILIKAMEELREAKASFQKAQAEKDTAINIGRASRRITAACQALCDLGLGPDLECRVTLYPIGRHR